MKKVLITQYLKAVAILVVGISVFTNTAFGQASGYGFTATTGTYADLSSGSTSTSLGATTDDGLSSTITLPFTFNFAGTDYTGCKVSSNGWLTFNTGISSSYNFNSTGNANNAKPVLAPLWDDLRNINFAPRYRTDGTAPNRIFKMEWQSEWNYNSGDAVMSFQVWLYEGSDQIDFVYQQEPDAVNSASATIGIYDAASTYLTLNNASGSPTASSSTFTTSINSKPATGQIYRWTAPTCFAPSSPTVTATTNNSATFSWTAPGNAPNGYDFLVQSPVAPDPTSGSTPTGSTLDPVVTGSASGLLAGTAYELWVRSDCGGSDQTAWIGPVDFTTDCDPFTVPWTDDYETATVGTDGHPDCWFEQNGQWEVANAADNTYNDPRSGDRYLLNNWTATSEYMWTPGMDLTAGTSYDFKFWFAGDGNSGWTGTVFVNDAQSSTGGSGASQLGSEFISSGTTSTSTYQEVTRSFTPTVDGTYYFAVRHTASGGPWYIGFDDFSVTLTPACTAPTGLALAITGSTTADISWVEAGDYIVEYGASGFTPGTGASAGGGTIATSTGSSPYSITFPLATTEYDVYIRQACTSPTAYSSNTGPVSFLPGDVCANAIDLGALTSPYSGTTVGAGSDFSLSCGTNSAPDLVFSIDVPDGSTFNITNTTPSYDSRIAMFYGGACPGTTEIACWDDPDDQTNSWTNTTGVTQTIYWVQDGFSSNSGTFTLDWELVTCGSQPSALVSSAVTATTATIGWDAATIPPASYDYHVNTTGTLPGSPSVTNVPSGTSANLGTPTALTPNTTYYYWVRSNCGGGEVSDWVGPESFTTPCAAFTVPWTDDIESVTTVGTTSFPDCWSKQNGDWRSSSAATHSQNDPRSGDRYLTNRWSATSEYMWTPGVALTAGTGYEFKFWFAGDSNTGWTGTVFVNDAQSSTGGSGASQIGGEFVSSGDSPNNTYEEVSRTFVPTTTGTYYFAVRISASFNPFYMGFDDFSVTEAPPCSAPVATLNVTSTTTADITWAGSGTYLIEYGPAGYTPGTGALAGGAGTLESSSATSPYTITFSSPTAEYDVYLREDCTVPDFSANSSVMTFLPGDACANALDLGGLTSPYSSTTTGASNNITTVGSGCYNNSAPELVFSIDVANGETLTIGQTSNSYDSYNYLFYGGSCPGTTEIDCYDSDLIENTWTNTTGSTQTVYFVQDGWSTNNGTFTLEWDVVACGSEPSALNTSLITQTTATIGWTAAALPPASYDYYIGTSSTLPGSPSVTNVPTGTSVGLTGLTSATTYYYWVRSNCGGDVSDWVGPESFTTECPSFSVPWTDDYETATVGTNGHPACWSEQNGGWEAADAADNGYNDPRSGDRYLLNNWTATSEYMWTPGIDLTAGTSYDFKFWFAGDGNSGWTGTVFVNDAQSSTGGSGATQLGGEFISSSTTSTSTYQEVTRAFVPSANGTYYFAIRHTASSAPWYIGFDDFSVTETPDCLQPTGLALAITGSTTADISWVEAGNYIVEYGAAGFTPGIAAAAGTGGTIATSTGTSPYSITFPLATTEYDVYVRQVCTGPDYSPNSGPATFLPGDACANALDLGGLTSPYSSTTTGASNNITTVGSGCYNNSAPELVFSIDVANGETLTIGQTSNSYDSYNYLFYGGSCPGTTEIDCYDSDLIENTWTNTTGSTQTVYFVQDGWSTNNGTFTLEWDVVACGSEPSALNTSLITQTTATIGWTAAALPPASYDYYIGTSSTLPGSPSVTNVPTGTSVGLTGLTSATTYYYWVRSNCGGDVSDWVGPESFTTECPSFSVPWTDDYETATVGTNGHPACWSEQNGGWEAADAADNGYNDPRSGDRYLLNNWTATSEYMWTPGIDLTAGTSYDFKFWFAGDGNSGWTGTVFVNDAQSSTGGSGATQLGGEFISSSTTSTSTYQEVTRAFVPSANGTYYFAIRHTASSAPWYIGFDDFSVTESPQCGVPFDFVFSGPTTDPTVSWTEPVPAAAEGYQYIVQSTATPVPGPTATPDGTTAFGDNDFDLSGLTVGDTYYIWVRSDCDGLFGDWGATIYTVPLPNDDCATAINLPCASGVVTGTTVGSVAEIVSWGCFAESDYGVWYSFTGDGQITTVDVTGLSGFDLSLNIMSGSCGSFAQIACEDLAGSGGTESFTFTTVPGEDYFVYVAHWDWLGSTTGDFTIERTCVPAPPPPVNNECADAIALNCGDELIGDNENATTVGQPTGFCGTSPGGPGVWYTFEGNGFNATVATCGSNGTLGDTKMNVYTGSCGSLVCEAGNDDGCGGRSSVTISPTVAGETYYVLVTGFSGAEGSFDISLDCDVDVWTGTVNTDWSVAGNWSSGSVPGAADNALIPANPTGNNFPEVFGDYSVGLLRVDNGAEMSIEDGGAITVSFFADVNGDLNVSNNGSFVQPGGSVLAGSGTFHVTKNGSSEYDFWSSPITNFTGSLITGSYVYNPALGTDDPSDDEFDPGWVQVSGGSMIPGKGYARQNGLTTTFSGTANNGTVNIGVDYNAPAPVGVSWNLVGNPYPSGIDATDFLTTNLPILDAPAVYLWDDPGVQPYTVGNYATIGFGGGVAGPAPGSSNVPGDEIGTAQGFKVKVSADGNIVFNNAMRSTGNSAMLFRQAASKRLWLNISSTGLFNQTLVGFFDDGTEGVDIYDAPKLNSMADLSLYSMLNDEPYAIQGYGPFYQEAVFPIGMHAATQQEVVFEIDHVDGLENNDIYLEDAYVGVYHDLNAGSYVVMADPGITNDRFFIHFMPQSVTGIEDAEGTSFGAIMNDDVLIVSSRDNLNGIIEVFDMSGRMIFSRSNVSLNLDGTRFDMSNSSDGVYIIRFVGSEGTLSKKVLK